MRCAECANEATGTWRGWLAFRLDDPELDEQLGPYPGLVPGQPMIVFFCPVCAAREFGERFASLFAEPS